MRKILVHFKMEKKELQTYIIENVEDLERYTVEFPQKYPFVKKSFKECLNKGERIIVLFNGSWCVENPELIDIISYI